MSIEIYSTKNYTRFLGFKWLHYPYVVVERTADLGYILAVHMDPKYCYGGGCANLGTVIDLFNSGAERHPQIKGLLDGFTRQLVHEVQGNDEMLVIHGHFLNSTILEKLFHLENGDLLFYTSCNEGTVDKDGVPLPGWERMSIEDGKKHETVRWMLDLAGVAGIFKTTILK